MAALFSDLDLEPLSPRPNTRVLPQPKQIFRTSALHKLDTYEDTGRADTPQREKRRQKRKEKRVSFLFFPHGFNVCPVFVLNLRTHKDRRDTFCVKMLMSHISFKMSVRQRNNIMLPTAYSVLRNIFVLSVCACRIMLKKKTLTNLTTKFLPFRSLRRQQ